MENVFDPGQFLTTTLIGLAQKHPTIHGLWLLLSVIVAIMPRMFFENRYAGPLLHFLGFLSFFAPAGATGTFKLPFTRVQFPPRPVPPPPVRVDRPSVLQPPKPAGSSASQRASEAPTPAEGVRNTVVPLPRAPSSDPTDDPSGDPTDDGKPAA